jgi:hypothetical protein
MEGVWHLGDLEFKSIKTIFSKIVNIFFLLQEINISTLGHY